MTSSRGSPPRAVADICRRQPPPSRFGPNSISGKGPTPAWRLLLRQFSSALVLILIFAAAISAIVGEVQEAMIIGVIILASCGLSFSQEFVATRAMDALRRRIAQKSTVPRDGAQTTVPADELVRAI